MNKPLVFLFLVTSSFFGLSACGDSSVDSQAESSISYEVGRGVSQSVSDETGVLSVSPGEIDGCLTRSGGVPINVSWDVSRLGLTKARIMWNDPGTSFDQAKVWVEKGAVDSEKSGPWAVGGTKISLVDESGEIRAKIVLNEVRCDK